LSPLRATTADVRIWHKTESDGQPLTQINSAKLPMALVDGKCTAAATALFIPSGLVVAAFNFWWIPRLAAQRRRQSSTAVSAPQLFLARIWKIRHNIQTRLTSNF